jgi:hypothetical protein
VLRCQCLECLVARDHETEGIQGPRGRLSALGAERR